MVMCSREAQTSCGAFKKKKKTGRVEEGTASRTGVEGGSRACGRACERALVEHRVGPG